MPAKLRTPTTEFGSYVRMSRIKDGLSTPIVARRCSTTKSSLSYWELGLKRPDRNKLPELAEAIPSINLAKLVELYNIQSQYDLNNRISRARIKPLDALYEKIKVILSQVDEEEKITIMERLEEIVTEYNPQESYADNAGDSHQLENGDANQERIAEELPAVERSYVHPQRPVIF